MLGQRAQQKRGEGSMSWLLFNLLEPQSPAAGPPGRGVLQSLYEDEKWENYARFELLKSLSQSPLSSWCPSPSPCETENAAPLESKERISDFLSMLLLRC